MIRPPAISALFPHSTLFRSAGAAAAASRSAAFSPSIPSPVRELTATVGAPSRNRSEEHTSELQSRQYIVCRLLLEKKKEEHTSELQPRQYRVCRLLLEKKNS